MRRRNSSLPDGTTLVLGVLGSAVLMIPLLGYGPLIAVLLGLAVGTFVQERLPNWAT